MDLFIIREKIYSYFDLDDFSNFAKAFLQFVYEVKKEAEKYVRRELVEGNPFLRSCILQRRFIFTHQALIDKLLRSNINGFNNKLFKDIISQFLDPRTEGSFYVLSVKDNINKIQGNGILSKALDIPEDDVRYSIVSKRETVSKILIWILGVSGAFNTTLEDKFRPLVTQLSKKSFLCKEILSTFPDEIDSEIRYTYNYPERIR